MRPRFISNTVLAYEDTSQGHGCRIVGDPVAHHDAATRFRDADHLLGYVEGLGCEHGAEDGEGQSERMVAYLLQVARISFLKLQAAETCPRGSSVPGFHEVSGNVDSATSAPKRASGMAVAPSPQPRSRARSGGVIPIDSTTASPDSRMKAAISVNSPFPHSALFGFMMTTSGARCPRPFYPTQVRCGGCGSFGRLAGSCMDHRHQEVRWAISEARRPRPRPSKTHCTSPSRFSGRFRRWNSSGRSILSASRCDPWLWPSV